MTTDPSDEQDSGRRPPVRDSTTAFGRDPVLRGALLGMAAVVAVGVLGSAVALVTGNSDAVLSVVLGAVVAAVMPLGTLAVIGLTASRSPQALAAAVLVSYLVKLVAVAGLMVLFSSLGGVDRQILGVAALIGVVLGVAAEVVGLVRTPQLYVEP